MSARELEQFKKSDPFHYSLASTFSSSRIVRSYPFYIIWFLLLNSTVVCTYRRIKGRLKLKKAGKKITGDNFNNARHTANLASSTNEISAFIKSIFKGWQIKESDDGAVLKAEKGSIGFWGSILFHFGLITLFLGAGLSGFTRYDASFLITENQSVFLPDLILKSSEQRPFINLNPQATDAIINLKNINAKYGKNEQLTDIKADFSVAGMDNSYTKDAVQVNKPMYFKNLKFVIEKYGIAPNFIIRNRQNKTIDDFVINLGDWLPENWTQKGTFDSFEIPNSNLIAKVFFIPNYKKIKGQIVSRGRLVKNPAFLIKFLDKKTLKEVSSSVIQKGQGAKFGDKELVFKKLNYWGFFRMSKDSGVPVVIFALIAGLGGLALRFIYHEKMVWFSFAEDGSGTVLRLGGRTKYFPALFDDEINKIQDRIVDKFQILEGGQIDKS